MFRIFSCILLAFVLTSTAYAGILGEKNYTKREQAYLRDVAKRDAKRKYDDKIINREPSGKMTVEEYLNLSKHQNPETEGEIRPVEVPRTPIPSNMKYVPNPTYKVVKYNNPPGSPELSLTKNFYITKQQNAQGIVSPDYTKLVYPAIYYSPDSASTSAEIFEIPLDTSMTELERIKHAHTQNRIDRPLISTSKTIDNFQTFRTLTPIDFNSDGTLLLVKEKIGNSGDGIWQTNIWIYDFENKQAHELSEIRDAIVHSWTTYHNVPLIDKRWDIVPLGFSSENPNSVVCTAYAYTGKAPVFLGVWSIDVNGEQSQLISMDTASSINVSQNGYKLVQDGVESYIWVESEEKQLKKIDEQKKKAQKKAEKNYKKNAKANYKSEVKQINSQYKEDIKEYNRLDKFQGSTTYGEGIVQYKDAKIKDLEKTIQKEEKQINKLNTQIDSLNNKLEQFEYPNSNEAQN